MPRNPKTKASRRPNNPLSAEVKKLKKLKKKAIVKMAGYKNLKALVKDIPSMVNPSKTDIIKLMV